MAFQAIWRFFVGEDMRWRWQQLSVDRSVVAESPISHSCYDTCIADAQKRGYVFEAAQGKVVRPGNDSFPRR